VLAALGERAGGGIEARVLPDAELAAVAVALQGTGGDDGGHLDVIALEVATACLVEELHRAALSARS
jgi:hypothetical protein